MCSLRASGPSVEAADDLMIGVLSAYGFRTKDSNGVPLPIHAVSLPSSRESFYVFRCGESCVSLHTTAVFVGIAALVVATTIAAAFQEVC